MKCIRIEGPNGRGIFRQKKGIFDYYQEDVVDELPCLSEISLTASKRHNDFNTPEEDGVDMERGNKYWKCAYKTVEQLQSWLSSEEIVLIIETGYDIYLLEVTEFQIGRKHQIVYTVDTIIEKTNINSLFL